MKKRYLLAGATGMAAAIVAAKLLRRPHDVVWAQHARDLHHAEYSYFSVINGVRIHYQEAGPETGPAIILIHGFCSSNFIWSDVFLRIADAGYRVIAPDLVGFGFSEKPGSAQYTLEMQSRMITGLMDELGIERATLVGSSYGGAVAAATAMDFPDRVENLVMVGAVINDDVKRQFLFRLGGTPLVGDVLSPLMLDSKLLMRWRMRMIYAPENAHLLDEARILSHQRPLRTANSHRAALKTFRNWKANRIEQNADQIRQPTLLIWGEHDADIPVEHGWRLFDAIPGSRLFVFKHSGHLPQEEYPEEFVDVLTGFLSDRERASEETLSLPDSVFDSRSAAQPAATGADNILDIDRPIA